MLLLIDNYDSFTYNLFQYLSELGEEVIGKTIIVINKQQHDWLPPPALWP